jgi:hypothetical protein
MQRRILVLLIGLALLMLAAVPTALAGPNGTDRPFRGAASGEVLYGYEDGLGTYGLSNVFDCDEGKDLPEEWADYFRVTTFASTTGTASHLGRVHLEFAHCPHPETGPVDGQLGMVAANGDVLYGEYDGREDGSILITFLPEMTEARPLCGLLNDVPCESTGRFAEASGTTILEFGAEPSDEEDLFQPWSWWGNWRGEISY